MIWRSLEKDSEDTKRQLLFELVANYPNFSKIVVGGYNPSKDIKRLHTLYCTSKTKQKIEWLKDQITLYGESIDKLKVNDCSSSLIKQLEANVQDTEDELNRERKLLLHKQLGYEQHRLATLQHSHPAEQMICKSRIKSLQMLLTEQKCWPYCPHTNPCGLEDGTVHCIE